MSTRPRQLMLAPHDKYAAAKAKKTTSIMSLPTELLVVVAEEADPEDLPSLRLTCRILRDVSNKAFGTKRLAHRRFILTEYSMQGLIDLTAHPIFGPCVKSILFGVHRAITNMDTVALILQIGQVKNMLVTAEALQQHKKCTKREREFLRSEKQVEALAQALKNLECYGTAVVLGVYDDQMAGYGFEEMFGQISEDVLLSHHSYALSSIDAGIRKSEYPHKNYKLLCDKFLPDCYEGRDSSVEKVLEEAIHLLFDPDGKPREDVTLIFSEPKGKSLRIDMANKLVNFEGHDHPLCSLFDSVIHGPVGELLAVPFLQKLNFHRCFLNWDEFQPILEAQCENLKVLEISHLFLRTYEPWVDVLGMLETALHLHDPRCNLQNLKVHRMGCYWQKEADEQIYIEGPYDWQSKEEIIAGLDRLDAERQEQCAEWEGEGRLEQENRQADFNAYIAAGGDEASYPGEI